jgi:hypothetical protein
MPSLSPPNRHDPARQQRSGTRLGIAAMRRCVLRQEPRHGHVGQVEGGEVPADDC